MFYVCVYYSILFPSPFSFTYSLRYQCGVPVIIEGETGVGKTALVEMLSKLWNQSLLVLWKRQCSRLLDLIRRKLGDISVDVSDNYQVCHSLCGTTFFQDLWDGAPSLFFLPISSLSQLCVKTIERLVAGQHISEEDLVLLGQLPDATQGHEQLFILLRSFLLPMKSDPLVTLLTLQESQQQELSLEQLFVRAESEDSAEVCAGSIRWYQLYLVLLEVERAYVSASRHTACTILFPTHKHTPVHSQPALWSAECSNQAHLLQTERACCHDTCWYMESFEASFQTGQEAVGCF